MIGDVFRRWNDTDSRKWLVEIFAVGNLLFLAIDVWLAHSFNQFAHPAEWTPVVFSATFPLALIPGLFSGRWSEGTGRWLGYLVGWLSIGVGLAGILYHLESGFFHELTIHRLVYSAPFVAPLSYTGVGLLLVCNRMEDDERWSDWILLLALAGFVGNFGLSLLDHAQNGFWVWTEYIPVVTGAYACGFLAAALWIDSQPFQWLTLGVMGVQALVGLLGFVLHVAANLDPAGPGLYEQFVYGAPAFAPLLFPNLAILAAFALWDRLDD